MGRIDLRKFADVRHLVRARLLSSEFHDLEKIVKEHIAADVWKTYYLSLPAPDGFAPWDITYSLLEEWPGVTIDDLSDAAEENEVGTQTMMKMSDVLQAYLDAPPWDDSPAMYVITTEGSYCGASAVLDKTIQQKLCEVFPDGCFILPSSIHECLAVSSDMDVHALAHMVHEINRAEVAEIDRLSDHVFSLREGVISVAA